MAHCASDPVDVDGGVVELASLSVQEVGCLLTASGGGLQKFREAFAVAEITGRCVGCLGE